MPATLLLGQPVVDDMLDRLAHEPGATLAVIEQDDPECRSYMRQLRSVAARLANLRLETHLLARTATLPELRDMMESLNAKPDVSGYMLQLPLPQPLRHSMPEVERWMAPEKDIDVLGPMQRGNVFRKQEGQILPPTPYAVMKLLKHHGFSVRGKVVAVIGDGHVGRLLKVMLGNDGATQHVYNEHTPAQVLEQGLKLADIVIGAAPVPDQITGSMIRPGSTVINVGMKFDDAAKAMRGNVHVESVQETAANVSPVFKGLGPVTVAALIRNAFRAAEKARE